MSSAHTLKRTTQQVHRLPAEEKGQSADAPLKTQSRSSIASDGIPTSIAKSDASPVPVKPTTVGESGAPKDIVTAKASGGTTKVSVPTKTATSSASRAVETPSPARSEAIKPTSTPSSAPRSSPASTSSPKQASSTAAPKPVTTTARKPTATSTVTSAGATATSRPVLTTTSITAEQIRNSSQSGTAADAEKDKAKAEKKPRLNAAQIANAREKPLPPLPSSPSLAAKLLTKVVSRSSDMPPEERKKKKKSLLSKLLKHFKKDKSKYKDNYQYYQPDFAPQYMPDLDYVEWDDNGDFCFVENKIPKYTREPRRRALCIGINYYSGERPLRGCIPDAERVWYYLKYTCGFEDIRFRCDRPDWHKDTWPYKDVVIQDMMWLVEDAMPGDVLAFFFAGHGTQVPDEHGDEEDGLDEAICTLRSRVNNPRDKWPTLLLDDDINDILVAKLPPGCSLFTMFDCCHSGSMMDLPFQYCPTGRVPNIPTLRTYDYGNLTPKRPHVIMISGCRDEQTSGETQDDYGRHGGMMTTALMEFVERQARKNEPYSYVQLLYIIRSKISAQSPYSRDDQSPQLATLFEEDLLGICCILPNKSWPVRAKL